MVLSRLSNKAHFDDVSFLELFDWWFIIKAPASEEFLPDSIPVL
jgi:hypothetical protein